MPPGIEAHPPLYVYQYTPTSGLLFTSSYWLTPTVLWKSLAIGCMSSQSII